MQQTVNEEGNDGGSVTVALPEPCDCERCTIAKTVTGLAQTRNREGWDTTAGHACSNMMEMFDALPPEGIDYLTPDSVKEQRARILKAIPIQAAALARALSSSLPKGES